MGIHFSKLFGGMLWRRQQVRLLMLGLDGAGKTTVLLRLKLGAYVSTVPTVGFNVERVEYGSRLSFTVWDAGGQDALRPLWRPLFRSSDALIFVVDSNDGERLPEARRELGKLLTEAELGRCPLLVLANKQDLPHALAGAEVQRGLGLDKVGARRQWRVQETCAATGEGVLEGLDWLAAHLPEP